MKIIRSHKPDIVHEWENSGLSYGVEVEDTAFGDTFVFMGSSI